jgi:hypothetical protein
MHGALRKIALDCQDNLPQVRTAASGSKKALTFSIMSSGSDLTIEFAKRLYVIRNLVYTL